MHMEMTANTYAVSVSTMPLVTEIKGRVQMDVKKVITEVIVDSVSVSNHFTYIYKLFNIEFLFIKFTLEIYFLLTGGRYSTLVR